MKTTVEIADALLDRLRQKATAERTTVRALLDTAIRQFLGQHQRRPKRFKMRDGSVGGTGLVKGLREGDWEAIRERAYEGRGG